MEVKKAKQDIVIMAFLVAVSALFYFKIIPDQILLSSAWSGNISFTSRTFPYLLMIALGSISAVGLVRATVAYRRFAKVKPEEKAQNEAKSNTRSYGVSFLVFALIVLYCVLFKTLGYIAATLLVPPVLLWVLDCRKWQFYLIIYAFAAVLYGTFKIILHVPLP